MFASQWFMPTLKEIPKDAEIMSHQLMLRAGLIKKLGAGLYTWLPTGLKVLQNIERIIREELNRIGALELLMPAIQPAELWQETGRWETFGGQLLTMTDSQDRAYCFGPTHEEVVTDIMRQDLKSYKQLPVTVYQIQTKFRDEIRPRFGVMRAREFIMKDAYSFHLESACLEKTYQAMYQAYQTIFQRMGLSFRAVDADTGAIGGAVSHEFQVLAETGEDILFYSDKSDYAANREQATSFTPTPANEPTSLSLTKVETKDQTDIETVSQALAIEPKNMLKTLIVEGKEQPLIALVLRGDDALNEIKASKHPWIKSPLTFAAPDIVQKTLGVPIGYLGPINLSIPMIVDHQARALNPFTCGANEANAHYQNGCWIRDVTAHEVYDLREVKVGDPSPDGLGTLQTCRCIEVGHIFQLGSKYAEAMKATVMNENGKPQTMIMGCYGIGVSRLVAATIEQHHDANGIIWPDAIAPFQISLIPIQFRRSTIVQEAALTLYQTLKSSGFDVLLDDRDERPGVLFADNDLLGIPHRLVISEKNIQNGLIEYKARQHAEPTLISFNDIEMFLRKTMQG